MKNLGFDLSIDKNFNFHYGHDVFGPIAEKRTIKDIEKSLPEFQQESNKVLYSIAMNVGLKKDQALIRQHHLVYGIVVYATHGINNYAVQSQGHRHAISKYSKQSTPEVFQIIEGKAIIYMQADDSDECIAISASEQDIVIVPPNWIHAVINASSINRMVFAAWCVADYAFDYTDVRIHQGIAFFPYFSEEKKLQWKRNKNYFQKKLIEIDALEYPQFKIKAKKSLYEQFICYPDLFDFIVHPNIMKDYWKSEKICKY